MTPRSVHLVMRSSSLDLPQTPTAAREAVTRGDRTPIARVRRLVRLGAAVGAGMLVLGVVGVSGTAFAKDQPTVSVGKVKGVGNVLVDSKNRTLYTLVKDHESVDCTDECATMGFVPLTVKQGTKPTAGKGV